MINLDYASNTPVSAEVLAEFCRVENECVGNAFARHSLGEAARTELERATEGIAMSLGMGIKPSEIIFTSGASEGNNLAIKGIVRAYSHTGKHILSTCLEHPSVSGALAFLSETGREIELLRILSNGKIDLQHLKTALRNDTILLCISAVDSELGAIQPLEEIAEIVANYPNCHLHIDAAQAMGKIPISMDNAKFSTLCFSPHKFHGLCGFGVLVKREGVVLEPLIHGGTSSYNNGIYRGGTLSPSLAASCFHALKNALESQEQNLKTVRELRDYVIKNLPEAAIMNSPTDGSPYILNLSIPSIKGVEFQAALNNRGIAVSVKSACSTDNAPSRPVFAVSGSKKQALSSWRVSFSHLTTKAEIDTLLFAVNEITERRETL